MATPAPYVIITSFAQDQANNVAGRSTVRTDRIDAEFQNIALSVNATITNLGLIQRSDGALANNIVTMGSLAASLLALFGQNLKARGLWLTGTVYAANDVVETGATAASYVCLVPHTSGVFATDRANGDWMLFGTTVSATPSFTTVSVTGALTAASVISAILDSGATGQIVFRVGGLNYWQITNPNLLPTTDNVSSIGSAGARVVAVFTTIIDSGTVGVVSIKVNNGETIADFNRGAGVTTNWISFQGSITGGAVSIFPSGSVDTNIGLNLYSRGTGTVSFLTNIATPVTQLQVLHTALATRNVTITGSNGGNPTIGVTGGSLAITPAVVFGAGITLGVSPTIAVASGSLAITPDVVMAATLSIGITPALSGTIRLPDSGSISFRNNINTADLETLASVTINGFARVTRLGSGGAGVVWSARVVSGIPTTSDIVAGQCALWRDSTGSTTKLYYNNGGTLQSVALT